METIKLGITVSRLHIAVIACDECTHKILQKYDDRWITYDTLIIFQKLNFINMVIMSVLQILNFKRNLYKWLKSEWDKGADRYFDHCTICVLNIGTRLHYINDYGVNVCLHCYYTSNFRKNYRTVIYNTWIQI